LYSILFFLHAIFFFLCFFFFSSRRRHTRSKRDWSSDVCSSDLDYYLVVAALVPYKRIDLAIGAARRLGRRLVIVGAGPEDRRLRALAGPGIEFLGWPADGEVADLYARCRAVLFPAVEESGVVPLEA